MAASRLSLLLLGASSALASPLVPRQESAATTTVTVTAAAPTSTAWDAGAVHEYPIHQSCNSTEAAYIKRGLEETIKISAHARDHILRWGNSSEIYQKYFGNASTGEPIGWFDKIVNGDKAGILFRCDNPDGNCENEGWAGHWRGENATAETVICPLSYETRKPLEGMCGFGYDVANGPTNFYWASDLLHRLLHIPKVGEGVVEHYAGEYDECLELAENHPEEAVRNSDTLQYFALEAYAYDIAVPGEGCAGKWTPTSSEAAPAATQTPTGTTPEAPSATSEAAKECHTHSDGVVHCT
ncbi:zincin [Corynespora cassiicola Philippines]|uniref:Zincin n=1 Tax=Corynespora cassiicola Philippines TaxID=1448308 RepID=A0A2T2P472_CORCC|nr:zincin [Corynespora cassiicola Philippines]